MTTRFHLHPTVSILAIVLAASIYAQQPVAPTTETVGSPRGTTWEGYNIRNSFELGYRWHNVNGDAGKYRSDVNYRNGVRLLSSSLSIHSREGQGGLFDELLLNTQGLGNDPYEFASFRIQKNKVYRYDGAWRSNEYYNPALSIAFGQHFMDTARRIQDHDFVLLPQSNFRLLAGYSRNTQSGPALNTQNIGEHRGDEFTLFSAVRRQQNEYRIGAEASVLGMKLHLLRGWENFKEDTPYDLRTGSANAGRNTTDANTLTQYLRRQPYHGNSPYWRVGLFREGKEMWAVNGRFTYTDGRRRFVSDELFSGEAARVGAFNRQILSFGDARRPVATGNVTVTLFPTERVTLSIHNALYNVRTEGDAAYRELNNSTLDFSLFNYRYLGIRTFFHSTEATVLAAKWLTFAAGYQNSNRRIVSVEQAEFDGSDPERTRTEQTNQVHSGTFGIRLRPQKGLSIHLDSEVGRADTPIFTTSERNYHALGARIMYKLKTLSLSAQTRASYNFNSNSLTAFSSRGRNYQADGSWTPASGPLANIFSLNGGYAKLHLDTLGGILFFTGLTENAGRYGYYSNIHSGYVNARVSIRSRADVYLGYSRVEDKGDGRRRSGALLVPGTAQPFSESAAVFPMAYQSPMARLSLRLNQRLRFNLGYQHYNYRQNFATVVLPDQSYRAHTGYTSLQWAF